jgi:hypothetical protein
MGMCCFNDPAFDFTQYSIAYCISHDLPKKWCDPDSFLIPFHYSPHFLTMSINAKERYRIGWHP